MFIRTVAFIKINTIVYQMDGLAGYFNNYLLY